MLKTVELALSEVGYKEKATNANLDSKTANAGHNNYTKYGRDLYNAGYYNGNKNGYAWCDQFVDWLFFKVYGAKEGQRIECQTSELGACCTYSMQYYKAKGRLDMNPKVGDQIFFRYSSGTGSDHTGIVVDVTSTTVTTVEGNSSDVVKKITYKRGDKTIVGYGHPLYPEEVKKEVLLTFQFPQLQKGDNNYNVKILQVLLNGLGYNCGVVDGDFGNNTFEAVKKYQKANGLTVDGIVGQQTLNKIFGR